MSNGTGSKILSVIGEIVQVAVPAASGLVPVVMAAIADIKASEDGQTLTYTLAVQQGEAALTTADSLDEQTLSEVNAELAKLGLPPLQSAAPAAPQTADEATEAQPAEAQPT